MKININTKPRGSVLLISLMIVALILTALGSYLLLISNESRAVTRSQEWNTCVPVMEAGIEEALTQIRYTGITSLSSNNWTLGSDGAYHKTRTVGSDGSFCKVTIQGTNPPTIYSEAYVPAALSTNYVVREVRISTQSSGGMAGLNARGKISITGGLVDSYNSSLGAYNPSNHGTSAIVLTDTNLSGSISLSGSAKIYGMAVSGPGTNTISTSGGATIGDANWNSTGGNSSLSPNAEPGWTANDAAVQISDVATPSFANFYVAFTAFGNTNIAGASNTVSYYEVPTIASSDSTKPLLIYGTTTIYCTQTGNNVINVSGSGYIKLMPGANVTIYTAGNVVVSGGGIVNGTTTPSNLHIYGLPTCTSVVYSGSASYYGVVDAPEADFTYSGSADAYGAFTTKTITISGGAGVHADQALGNGGYTVAAWNEIRPM